MSHHSDSGRFVASRGFKRGGSGVVDEKKAQNAVKVTTITASKISAHLSPRAII